MQKVLEQNGYKASKKAIDAAGFCVLKPRYFQMIKVTNKQKRVDFCAYLIQEDDTFDDAIFSDENSIQSHGIQKKGCLCTSAVPTQTSP